MFKRNYFFSLAFMGLFITELSSQEIKKYGNISVQANIVTLNESTNNLALYGELKINFGDFNISGDNALLGYDEEKLIINGSPASISSTIRKISGTANQLTIYPNLSIEMVGEASLIKENRSIFSEKITYQITSND